MAAQITQMLMGTGAPSRISRAGWSQAEMEIVGNCPSIDPALEMK